MAAAVGATFVGTACDVEEVTFRAPRMAAVTTGDEHSCALSEGGVAYCWGLGDSGQLGTGSVNNQQFATRVSGNRTFATIDAGGRHTCALTEGGEAYCWGANEAGQLGDGSREQSLEPVRAQTSERFIAVSAGAAHTCGITDEGRVLCWGSDEYGQAGNGAAMLGTAAPAFVQSELTFRKISAGVRHTCAITTTDEAYCWGANSVAQLGIGSAGSPEEAPVRVVAPFGFRDISAGWNHSCGVSISRVGYCWGENAFGETGNGWRHESGLPAEVVPAPVTSYGEISFVQISAGRSFSCGTRDQGSAYCWGRGEFGQLGNAGLTDSINPQWVRPGPGRTFVGASDLFATVDAGGEGHACAIGYDGTVYCWGQGDSGQLGTGERLSNIPYPVQTER